MGGVESTEGGIQGVDGLQVGSLLPRSPAHQAGLIPFFDFIVKVDSHEQKEGSAEGFREYLKKHKGSNVKLTVYNSKVMALREVILAPDDGWGGNGLLGCSLEWGNTTMSWHVSSVSKASPAAGVLSAEGEDYIIGAEKEPASKKPVITLFCDDSDFHSRVSEKMSLRLSGKAADQLLLLIYNNKDNTIREEYVALGNSTALGIDVGNGYLHNISPGKLLPVMKRFISLDASASKVRTESIVMNDSSPSQTPSATPKAVQQQQTPVPVVPLPVQPSQQLQQQLLQQRQVGEDHFNSLLRQKEEQLLKRDRENEEMRLRLLAQQQEQENQRRLIEQLQQQQGAPAAQPMSQQEIAAAKVSELMGGSETLTNLTDINEVDILAAQKAEMLQQQPLADQLLQLKEEKESAERLMCQQQESEKLHQQQEDAERQRQEAEQLRQQYQQQQQLEAERLQQQQQQLEAERVLFQQQQQQLEAERLQQQQAAEAERRRVAEVTRLHQAQLQEQEADNLRMQQAQAEAQRQQEVKAAQLFASQQAEAQRQQEAAQLFASQQAEAEVRRQQEIAAAQQLAAQQAQQEVERIQAQEQQAFEIAKSQQAVGNMSLGGSVGGSPFVASAATSSSQVSSPYTPHSPNGKGVTAATGGFNTGAPPVGLHHSALSSLTHSPTPSSSASQTARRSSLITEDYSMQDPTMMSFPMYGA